MTHFPPSETGINDLTRRIDDKVAEIAPHLVALRRDIHAHPEIGFETQRTADLVAHELRQMGLEVTTGIGRTGVIAEITGALPGPCLILRADMDALPIEERTDLPFASQIQGAMHACGHDIHTSALLGAAYVLRDLTQELAGRVRLVFQPAEETVESGAAAMIADGAAEGADMAIAFHNQPELPAGELRLIHGASTASSDEFCVTVLGSSGHAARPHLALDPIVACAHIITQLQTIVSRRMDPADPMVLTIGQIAGGFTENIIPDSCSFKGTIRCRSAQTRDMAEERFRQICTDTARALGVRAEVTYLRGAPALQNDKTLVDRALTSLSAHFGTAPHTQTGTDFGAEDFSYFSERLPALQFHVGSGQPGRDDRLHNSDYQPDESAITLSARALSRLAADFLSPAR
ncbi:M20 family metallopeptidase [Thioclava sp. FTW29]|uniref:M20 family metallopeptidase n=1 Tax=Thioclava litoralis TaxID=3076557 RepID=A0ABZ1E589_9RHOB|nr:M20 family metallopeptidase [Thioclava sp. FTW29]